jgi:hypothetical protein
MHGRKNEWKRSLGGLVTAGLQRAKRFREYGGLVLVARDGFFIPNGNNNRSHRGTTLLDLLVAGSGGAGAVMERRGHGSYAIRYRA